MSTLVVVLTGAQKVSLSLSGWRYLKKKIVMRPARSAVSGFRVLGLSDLGRWNEYLLPGSIKDPTSVTPCADFSIIHRNGDAEVWGTRYRFCGQEPERILSTAASSVTLPCLTASLSRKPSLEARRPGLNFSRCTRYLRRLGWCVVFHMIGRLSCDGFGTNTPFDYCRVGVKARSRNVQGASIGSSFRCSSTCFSGFIGLGFIDPVRHFL